MINRMRSESPASMSVTRTAGDWAQQICKCKDSGQNHHFNSTKKEKTNNNFKKIFNLTAHKQNYGKSIPYI